MKRTTLPMMCLSMAIGLAGILPLAANAQTSPEEQFQLLYGDKYNEVMKSRVDVDNIELAKDMTEVLSYDDIDLEFKTYIADKILEMAPADDERSWEALEITTEWMLGADSKLKAKALETQAEILRVKIVKTPRAQRPEAYVAFYNRLIDAAVAYESQMELDKAFDLYRKGSSVSRFIPRDARTLARDGLKRIAKLRLLQKEVETLKSEFVQAPSKDLAKKIAIIYLVDFNNPQEAAPFAVASEDPGLVAIAKVTDQVTEDITPEDALAAGNAYGSLASQADDTVKARPLSQAIAYLDLYLEKDESKGIIRIKATQDRRKFAEQLDKLGGAVNQLASRSIDVTAFLAKNWTEYSKKYMSDKDAKHWSLSGKQFQIAWGNRDGGWGPMLHFPVKVTGEYELSMEVVPGKRGYVLILPLDKRRTQINIRTTGMHKQGGKMEKAQGNKTMRFITIDTPAVEPGATQKISFKVKSSRGAVAIQCKADGEVIFEWEGKQTELAHGYMKYGGVSSFGVAPYRHSGIFAVKEVKVSGSVKLEEPEVKGKE